MKNVFRLIGIIALAAVIGFSFIACNDLLNSLNSDGGGGTGGGGGNTGGGGSGGGGGGGRDSNLVNAANQAWVSNTTVNTAGKREALIFKSDGTFQLLNNIPSEWMLDYTGTWYTSGNSLTLTAGGTTLTFSYTVSGNTLTLGYNGRTQAYTKTTITTSGGGGGGGAHTHTYSSSWSSNATQHWHDCIANDGAKTDLANHSGSPCTVCGYTNTSSGGGGDNSGSYNLGDTGPGGGKIFYYSASGFRMTDNNQLCHYLEAAADNTPTQLAWASSGYTDTDIPGTEREIGAGRKNTALILAIDAAAPAALACKNFTAGGKTDWFLPSYDELDQLIKNERYVGNLRNRGGTYATSNQGNSRRDMIYGSASLGSFWNVSKYYEHLVRPVRAF